MEILGIGAGPFFHPFSMYCPSKRMARRMVLF
jgi:hypothetical protein